MRRDEGRGGKIKEERGGEEKGEGEKERECYDKEGSEYLVS